MNKKEKEEDSRGKKREHCSSCPFFLLMKGEAYCGFPEPRKEGNTIMKTKLEKIAFCDRWRRTRHTIPFYCKQEDEE